MVTVTSSFTDEEFAEFNEDMVQSKRHPVWSLPLFLKMQTVVMSRASSLSAFNNQILDELRDISERAAGDHSNSRTSNCWGKKRF